MSARDASAVVGKRIMDMVEKIDRCPMPTKMLCEEIARRAYKEQADNRAQIIYTTEEEVMQKATVDLFYAAMADLGMAVVMLEVNKQHPERLK